MMKSIEEIYEFCESISDDEYLEFYKVEPKLSQIPMLHAFIRLEQWFASSDIIVGTSHDEIHLNYDVEDFLALDEQQLLELVRCGVRVEHNGVRMFV